MVKSWRYFDKAIKHLLSEKLRHDLKERARYIAVNPDLCEVKEEKQGFAVKAKRTMSPRRQNFSDGFFSSEDSEAHHPVKQANA